ncbi:hypothetical protein PLESTB_000386300 [Pleodorina starrii]|uniref:Uncharacterized protein n=1 Tax=Pleodorina starrii TaxID=330485 RepID=A0A9W6BEU7_9CHLO|nr:hypothetical protein PLESTB_000386300 [Pleodorina starrii]
MDGGLRRQLNLWWLSDPEDVVYVSSDRVAVLEEPPWGGIRVLDVSQSGGGKQVVGEGFVSLTYPRTAAFGAEGLAHDPGTGTYYVAQEKHPKSIIAVREDGWQLLIDGDVAFNSVGDLAAINYIPGLKQFLVLSQESSRVLKTTLDGQVLQYLDVEGPYAEGLHMMSDGLTLIVVGEVRRGGGGGEK